MCKNTTNARLNVKSFIKIELFQFKIALPAMTKQTE